MDPPKSADAIVIGGGIVGASAAYHLAELGMRSTVLLERRFLGAGATGKSGALVRMHYDNLPEARLAHSSMSLWQAWSDVIGGPSPFEACGAIRLVGPGNAERLRKNVEQLQSIGVNTHVISLDELSQLAPQIRTEGLALAAYEPTSGCADPIAAVHGFAGKAQTLGAVIRTGTAVQRILERDGKVEGVETDQGRILSSRVILAVGPWSSPFLASLGVEIPLLGVRVQLALFRVPPELENRRLVVLDGPIDQWMRPMPGPYLMTGSGARFEFFASPDDYNESANADYPDVARGGVVERVPALAAAVSMGGWAGVVASSPDGKPIIDSAPEMDGLFFAAADSGTSFKTAPAVGRGLAEWAFHGQPRTVDLHPFRARRFDDGEPVVGPFEYDEPGQERPVLRP